MTADQRIAIEKQIISYLIDQAIEAGFTLRVRSDDKWETERTTDRAGLVDACMCVDVVSIALFKGEQREGWICLVHGNDGTDVIADWSLQLEAFMTPIEEWIETTFE